MPEEITYAKVNGPPDNWYDMRVFDAKTGEEIKEVVEVNTAEGFLRRHKMRKGQLYVVDGKVVIERIRGRFAIEIRRRDNQ